MLNCQLHTHFQLSFNNCFLFAFLICPAESHSLQPQIKSEQHTKEINLDGSASFIPLNVDPIQESLVNYTRGDENPPDTGQRSQSLPYYPRKRRLKYGSPWRLRLDYLVAYGPPEKPLCYCMVCSEHLPVPRVSIFRKHIQECHPETSNLSRSDRDAVVSAWIKEEKIDKAAPKEDGKYRQHMTSNIDQTNYHHCKCHNLVLRKIII